jgi:hypothetical protein
MADEIRAGKRDLVARVATLELLVSDLVALLWKLDPALMEQLAQEAERDLTLQNSRTIPAAEHMRERLFGVLQDRKRRLKRRGDGRPRAVKEFEPDERLALGENLS